MGKNDKVVIANFGLHWREEWIRWGKQNSRGKLLGIEKGLHKEPVDFREQSGVYALYADFELVYIGETAARGLLVRLRDHINDHLSERWNRFSWFGTRAVDDRTKRLAHPPSSSGFDNKAVIDTLEAVSIAIAEPRLNLQRGQWPAPHTQFFQVDANAAAASGEQEPQAAPKAAAGGRKRHVKVTVKLAKQILKMHERGERATAIATKTELSIGTVNHVRSRKHPICKQLI